MTAIKPGNEIKPQMVVLILESGGFGASAYTFWAIQSMLSGAKGLQTIVTR